MKHRLFVKCALIAAAGLMAASVAGCNKPSSNNTAATAENTVSSDNSSNTMAPTSSDMSNTAGAGSQDGGHTPH